ncbi:MAG: helix-turn-helix domain-containing protein, partial [Brachymonas sp.]|nr:helix-turn-helix domain-containing protein [Brachymonas sp.]
SLFKALAMDDDTSPRTDSTPEVPDDTPAADTALANTSLPDAPPADTRTAGTLLREMREAAHADIETLASALKVTPQKLRALEADDYAALPALFFARGLAANICRHFGKDPAPVLEKMPGDKPRFVEPKEGLNTAIQSTSTLHLGNAPGWPRWLFGAAAVLVLAAAALFLWPRLSSGLKQVGIKAPAAASHAAEPVIDATEPVPPASAEAPAAATEGLPTLAPASMAASAAAASPTAEQSLHIAATGETWVQVTTPTGRKLYEGSLTAGQTHDVTIARYPVRVVVGKAENTRIVDRGQPFDLASVSNAGVARFELKP